MKTATVRNLRYQLRVMGQTLLFIVLTTAALLVWQVAITPWDRLAQTLARRSTSVLVISALIWISGIFVSQHTSVLPYTIGFGSTRKASFAAGQLIKPCYGAGLALIGLLAQLLNSVLLPGGDAIFGGSVAALLFCVVIFWSSAMELIGLIIKRFGKWGLILYMAIVTVFGGVCGFVGALSFDSAAIDNIIVNIAPSRGMLALCGGGLLLSALLMGINWRLYRNIEV